MFCKWTMDVHGILLGSQLGYLLGLVELAQQTLGDVLGQPRREVHRWVSDDMPLERTLARRCVQLIAQELKQPGAVAREAKATILGFGNTVLGKKDIERSAKVRRGRSVPTPATIG